MDKRESGALSEQTVDFSLRIWKLRDWLISQKEYVLSDQIFRSGTSIGANVYESHYAASLPDFINKMQTVLKEASETEYWLLLLEKSGKFDISFDSLRKDLISIKKLLISTINTSKAKLK